MENLFEKIMKENFPSLEKDIDFQEVQKAQRVPRKLDPRRNTTRHIIMTLPKMKDKERMLKAARGNETVTYRGVPIRLSDDFSKKTLHGITGMKEVFSDERQGPTSKIALSSKAIIQNGMADKVLPRQGQVKGVHHYPVLII